MRHPATGLAGRRILVTGLEAERLSRRLEEQGATALRVPMIGIRPVAEGGALDEAVQRLERYDWVVLTSPRGARAARLVRRRKGRRAYRANRRLNGCQLNTVLFNSRVGNGASGHGIGGRISCAGGRACPKPCNSCRSMRSTRGR